MFLGYALTGFEPSFAAWEKTAPGTPERESLAIVLRRAGGGSFTRESLTRHDISAHLAEELPPVYVTANLDDHTVPVGNSLKLIQALDARGASHRERVGRTGGHSFGVGRGLEAEGWIEEAIALFEESLPI